MIHSVFSRRLQAIERLEAAVSGKLNAMLLVNSGFLNKAQGSAYEFTNILQTTAAGNETDIMKTMTVPDEIVRSLPATGSQKSLTVIDVAGWMVEYVTWILGVF